MSDLKRRVEAILFAASKRMSANEIALLLEEKEKDIISSLNDLKKIYSEIDTSLAIISDDETWKMSLKDDYLDIAEKLMPGTDLPRPVIETLAIIAWKSPVMQADLVKIRSPVVYEHIAELEKLHLITRVKKGRSFLVKVTEKFFDYFDMPQDRASEVFGQYEEPTADAFVDEKKDFNKGDNFDDNQDDRDARILQEIKDNKIDPEEIIRKDREFLEDFDKKLHIIEENSFDADQALKSVERSESNSSDNSELNSEQDSLDVEKLEDEIHETTRELVDASSIGDVEEANSDDEDSSDSDVEEDLNEDIPLPDNEESDFQTDNNEESEDEKKEL